MEMPCHNFYINRAYGKKDSTKHYVNVSYSCPKNCAVFNSLKYWKKICWKFHNKTASVPLLKSINTHQFLHYIHAEQRMTFEKSSDINYIWQLWGLYVMDVNCKSCCLCWWLSSRFQESKNTLKYVNARFITQLFIFYHTCRGILHGFKLTA